MNAVSPAAAEHALNHGGETSNDVWLADVVRQVARDNVRMLPDFGDFRIIGIEDEGIRKTRALLERCL